FHGEECLARAPAVLHGQVPAHAAFALADDDVNTVVLHVERLASALHAVADDGDRLLAEYLLDSFGRIIRSLDDGFARVADLDLAHVLASSGWIYPRITRISTKE